MAWLLSMSQRRGVRLNALLFIVALLPVVVIAAVINRYGVNVPFADEWSNLILLEKWNAHQLGFADLYQEHNGHRIFFPRLFYLALAWQTHGNLRAEMFFSLFLCLLTSVGFYLLLRRTVPGSTKRHLLLWAFMNLFLFSPIQAENWLWGFQLQIFLSNFCLVGAIVCLSLDGKLPGFAAAVACAITGTFSFGNGLLIWPLGLLILAWRRATFFYVGTWIVTALLVLLAYLPGYQGHELVQPPPARWLEYPLYFTGFLGTPLARIPNSHPLILPVTVGTILVAGYLALALYSSRRRNALRDLAPWLALGAYAIGSAVLAARARIHFGPQHALDSRYTTISVLLILAVIGLEASLFFREELPARKLLRPSILIATLLVLYAINLPYELYYLKLHHGFRARGKAALQFSKVIDVLPMVRSDLLLTEDSITMTRYLEILDRLKLADPPRRETPALRDAENRTNLATSEYGLFENMRFESENALTASGWSFIPRDGRPSPRVILALRKGEEWIAFALSDKTERRPDLGSNTDLDQGWRCHFARNALPPGAQEISAWALDVEEGETYRLPGSFKLPR
jgi:hypothetical protein